MIHFVCEQCGAQEACPDMLMDEYDERHKRKEIPTDPKTQAPKG
jgi:hypothetical protein